MKHRANPATPLTTFPNPTAPRYRTGQLVYYRACGVLTGPARIVAMIIKGDHAPRYGLRGCTPGSTITGWWNAVDLAPLFPLPTVDPRRVYPDDETLPAEVNLSDHAPGCHCDHAPNTPCDSTLAGAFATKRGIP